MCGRYAYVLPPEAMLALFRMLNELIYPPRYNIAPTQPIATVWEQHGRRTAQLVRWGFVPAWVKDPREFRLLINARAEGILDRPSFRDAVRYHRCIVPASGYYEWSPGPDGTRRPYYITRADGEPMAFAGLYSTWIGTQGEEVDTAAIVTVPAGDDIAHLHDRMPAILRADEIDAWLDTKAVRGEAAAALAAPMPAGAVRFHRVGRDIGRATAEGPELIAPVDDNDDPPPRKAASGQLDLF